MGSRVQVGKITYVALDTDWEPELTGHSGTKRPEHRFLLVRVSMTNNGNDSAAVPLFTLIGANGAQHSEVSEGIENVNGWLGVLREIGPGQSLQGTAVFDVPRASYKLQVSDGGPIDSEKTALIDLPLDFNETPASTN